MRNTSLSDNQDECDNQRSWGLFLLSSAVTPVGLAVLLGILQTTQATQKFFVRHRRYSLTGSDGPSEFRSDAQATWFSYVSLLCAQVTSTERSSGKTLVLAEFCVGMISLSVYLYKVTWFNGAMEFCWRVNDGYPADWIVDFVCSLILLSCFVLRSMAPICEISGKSLKEVFVTLLPLKRSSLYGNWCATPQPWYFLIERDALINYCTIPPSFVSLVLHREWIGLRSLRVCHLLTLPDILQLYSLPLLRSRRTVRFTEIICLICSMLFGASGVFHMLENTGDFWLSHPRVHNISYFESIYFSFVTLSTVGYGDINPETTIGRLFCCVFVMTSLALFASSVPEVYILYLNRTRFACSYKPETGTGHVIVTGHLDGCFMGKFLKQFYQPEYKHKDVRVVFVGRRPDPVMESVLKVHRSTAFYLEGSVLTVADLRRARLRDAMACFLVTNKSTPYPSREDSTTIMLVTSIKNFHPDARCVVQIQQSRAKALLLNIPGFSLKKGDSSICFQEVEYGLIAQSCLAPGASTLLANLMQSPVTKMPFRTGNNEMLQQFLSGCQMELHLGRFSPYFTGMKFSQAAECCFLRLDVLLIGLFRPEPDNRKQGMLICPSLLAITDDRVGIFVAKSLEDVRRVVNFCITCHADETDPSKISECECEHELKVAYPYIRDPFRKMQSMCSFNLGRMSHQMLAKPPPGFGAKILDHIRDYPHTPVTAKRIPNGGCFTYDNQMQPEPPKRKQRQLDLTKAFHWCPSRSFRSVLLNRSIAARRSFKDHIVVLIMADSYDQPIGLRELVLPLRSSKIPYVELKEIVLLGDVVFLEKEWKQLYNFPKIVVVSGDPFGRADLRAVWINTCASCVVLSAWTGTSSDKVLDDRAAVLATLNIKAMVFDTDENAPELGFTGLNIPVITEIQHDCNVRLLDQYAASDGDDENDDIFLSEPYMCGKAVTLSSLDSMLVMTFHNPLAINIIRFLLWGYQSPFMESVLSEGIGLVAGDTSSDNQIPQFFNVGIKLVGLDDEMWATGNREKTASKGGRVLEHFVRHSNPVTWATSLQFTIYGELFSAAAKMGMICLGLSRLLCEVSEDPNRATKRCIFTNPSKELLLRNNDKVFILSQ